MRNIFRSSSIASAALAIAVSFSPVAVNTAKADVPVYAGGIAIGGQLTGYTGTIDLKSNIATSGSAVSATTIEGIGNSTQHTDGATFGQTLIGGNITPTGVLTIADSKFSSDINSRGNISGNAPIKIGDSLANATGGLGKVDLNITGSSTFKTEAIGGSLVIAGIGGIGQIGTIPGITFGQ